MVLTDLLNNLITGGSFFNESDYWVPRTPEGGFSDEYFQSVILFREVNIDQSNTQLLATRQGPILFHTTVQKAVMHLVRGKGTPCRRGGIARIMLF